MIFSLVVYLICHNRPELAKESIQSILKQKDKDFKFIISDNSTNDDVELMVRTYFSGITYVRRGSDISSLDHFNLCLSEITQDYFCLFHDDDLMMPDYTLTIKKYINLFPDAVALGCNCFHENEGVLEKEPPYLFKNSFKLINSPQVLLRGYFGQYQSGITPFPGYVYNKNKIGHLLFTSEGGKYQDVIWILKISNLGTIVWVKDPLMIYRTHGGNDSLTDSVRDRLSLMGFLKQNPSFTTPELIIDYRFFLYKKIRCTEKLLKNRKRLKKLTFQVWKFRTYRFFRIKYYFFVFKKLIGIL